jgi:hypothetical protein
MAALAVVICLVCNVMVARGRKRGGHKYTYNDNQVVCNPQAMRQAVEMGPPPKLDEADVEPFIGPQSPGYSVAAVDPPPPADPTQLDDLPPPPCYGDISGHFEAPPQYDDKF